MRRGAVAPARGSMARPGAFALCGTRVGNSGRYMTTGQSLYRLRKHWCAIPGLDQVIPFAYGSRMREPAALFGDQIGTTCYARWRTTCASVNVTHADIAPHTHGYQGKRITATYWGSSGRRSNLSARPRENRP